MPTGFNAIRRCVKLPGSLIFMRVYGFCILALLALVGYQAMELHAHDTNTLAGVSQVDHQTVQDAARHHEQRGGHADHTSNCWAHATCSPVSVAAIDQAITPEHALEPRSRSVIDYSSVTFTPTAPPPRA